MSGLNRDDELGYELPDEQQGTQSFRGGQAGTWLESLKTVTKACCDKRMYPIRRTHDQWIMLSLSSSHFRRWSATVSG